MNCMKRAFGLVLALCMVLSLVACGNGSGSGNSDASNGSASADASVSTPADGSNAATSSGEEPDDGRVTYTITVIDEDGNPISGAMVQICKDTCLPCGATNADGVVTVTTVEDDYKVSFMTPVEGYLGTDAEQNYYFDDGSYEMTIILTPAA